jgi:hypothetical protein
VKILGIDPGGTASGLVVRDRRTLIAHTTIFGDLLDPHYPGMVVARIELACEGCVIAMEDTSSPQWYSDGKAKPINLDGLRATERVAGAVLGRFSGVILVPPGGNGQGPLEAYPEELRPTRGHGKGHDRLRHERSAWSVAGAAVMLVKVRAVSR